MKYPIALSFLFVLFIQCFNETKHKQTICISNKKFVAILHEIDARSIQFKRSRNDTFSIGVALEANDTMISIFTYEQLNPKYYIGYANIDKKNIYFYALKPISLAGFYTLLETPPILSDSAFKEGFPEEWRYRYTNGNFIPMQNN